MAEAENNELKNTMITLLNQKIEDGKKEAKEAEAAKPKEEHKDHKHAPMSEERKAELGEVFNKMDANHDGSLTRAEICLAAMEDESGKFAELLRLPAVYTEDAEGDMFAEVFALMDADKSKKVSRAEFIQYFSMHDCKVAMEATKKDIAATKKEEA